MTAQDRYLLDNFLASYRRPFDAELMSVFTGVQPSACEARLAEGVRDGELTASGGVYVLRRDVSLEAGGWKYSRRGAEAILRCLALGDGRSLRSIAVKMGRSAQYVFKYMEALASIGVVRWDGDRYVVCGEDISRLGVEIEKGILGRQKEEAKCKRMRW